MLKVESFSAAEEMRIAALAGRILPLVRTNPETAFAAAIARILSGDKYPGSEFQNRVGAAMRCLEKNDFLYSEMSRHPKRSEPGKVKLYKLTPAGAFIAELKADPPPVKLTVKGIPSTPPQREADIVSILRSAPGSSLSDIYSNIDGVSSKTVSRELIRLIGQDKVRKKGTRRWTRYWLTSK